MLDGTYKIQAKTPLGDKSGTLKLQTSGEEIAAKLDVSGLGKVSARGSVAGNTFSFSGTHKVLLLGKITYEISGLVEGDKLEAVCQTNKGEIVILGTRVQ